MNLLFLEPFYGGSHKQWIDGYKNNSKHNITVYSLPDRFWKWRMHGAAITLSNKLNTTSNHFDVIIASDMLNISLFKSLLQKGKASIPIVCYFHENQLTYPWSSTDQDVELKRDQHYAFINYTSALASDKVLFNSRYHKNSFLEALPSFLNQFPDFNNSDTVDLIAQKSDVLHLGLELQFLVDGEKHKNNIPIILWNHRWEYDKNPVDFFNVLYALSDLGIPFQLIVLGEKSGKYPTVFDEAKKKLVNHIIHWGYATTREEYIALLLKSDLLPVTSCQDFFGISVIEAIAAGVTPLLPQRLAFPEIIGNNKFSNIFYKDEELYDNLKIKLQEATVNSDPLLRKSVLKYDWSNMVYKYDELFELLK